jgi:hypothetical protein
VPADAPINLNLGKRPPLFNHVTSLTRIMVAQEGTPLRQMPLDNPHHATSFAFAEETKFSNGLLVLMQNPYRYSIPPTIYLKAAGEGLFLTLLVSWIITFIFNPSIIRENPLKTRLGYNNLCVGWDSAPAAYIAVVLWIAVGYLGLRFAYMNQLRFSLDPAPNTFGVVANVCYGIGLCVFTLVLVIPPTQSVWMHSIPFIGYIWARFLIVWALFLEDWGTVTARGKIFLYFYAFVSAVLPIIYLSEYAYYAHYGAKSHWPYQITFGLDYAWFACLALTAKFLPSAIVIHQSFLLVAITPNVEIV